MNNETKARMYRDAMAVIQGFFSPSQVHIVHSENHAQIAYNYQAYQLSNVAVI